MNRVLCRLDDGKATLRILIELSTRAKLASRGQLEALLAESGVGRSALYSSLKVLNDLGLIVEKRERVDGKNLVLTDLTEKGKKIARVIQDLYLVLEQDFPG